VTAVSRTDLAEPVDTPDSPPAAPASAPAPGPPPEAYAALRERFGFDSFREGQAEVIAAVLAGRDVLCVMPTGAGKSLCYQVPALLLPGVTLVVSPLIALMKDQVDGLVRRGIAAAEVNSTVPPAEQDARIERAARGELRLLYVAPERFQSQRFRERMADVTVSRVAVDEAHCISQWGHDFRPDYRRLGAALTMLHRPPVLALTATAPREVQEDVVAQLSLREPVRHVTGIVRANLAFEVVQAAGAREKDLACLSRVRRPGASLVYCATRRHVDDLYDEFRLAGLKPRRYHAGLSEEERTAAQEAFLSGGEPLMVATNAFGMGVDRPDVRRVVHYDVPRTVEAYVQEAGRAGRDGKPAECSLLWHPADVYVQKFFIDAANPSREVVVEVFRVVREAGSRRLELTTEEIAKRMHVDAPPSAVGAALAVLDRAAIVRRGRRGENLAKVRLLPQAGELFASAPLPPGLTRLLAWLERRFGSLGGGELDLEKAAEETGRSEETLRRGLLRLHETGRVDYVPPFRGRATEVRVEGLPEDVLASVDFAALEEKRERDERKLDQMIGYAHAPGCRAAYLLDCFGEPAPAPCGRCDGCLAAARAGPAREVSASERRVLEAILRAVRSHDGKFGFGRLAAHLSGSTAASLPARLLHGETHGALASMSVARIESWLKTVHEAGLLSLRACRLDEMRTSHVVALSASGRAVLAGGAPPALRDPSARPPEERRRKKKRRR
jgi:ATP-dependent DNA helicase RecQ